MRLTPSVITQELIETIPDPVLVVATDDSVLLANQPAVRLCELDDSNVQSLHFAEIVTGNSSSGTPVTVRTCRSGRTIPVSDTRPHVRDPDVVVHVLRPEQSPVGASTVLDTLVEGVMVVSADGDILYVNQTARTMLGCRGGYPQADVREIITDPAGFDDPESAGAHLLDNLLSGRESTLNEPAIAICESASSVEVMLNASALNSANGRPSGAVITFLNITGQRHAELQISIQSRVMNAIAAGGGLYESSELLIEYLERVIPGSSVAVYQIERDSRNISLVAAGRIKPELRDALCPDSSDPISGMCVQALMRRSPMVIDAGDSLKDSDQAALNCLLVKSGIDSVWCHPVDAPPHRGVGLICLYRTAIGAPDRSQESLIQTATGLLRVTMDRVQIERELRYQSFNDDLTGLPNRVLMMDRVELAIQRAEQSDQLFALLLLNVDRFQMINNSLGHQAGDQMLREIARRLRVCVRSDDLVARFTGDSFAIVLDSLSSESDAINVVMRIQREFGTPLRINDVDLYVSVSIGIALSTEPELTVDSLVQYADIALNRAREAGRGQFAVFSPSLDLSRVPRLELQSKLHRALASDALDLHFQSVSSLQDGEVAGYEALIRWNDPEFGAISPDEFLPLAQQAGIMAEITSWVLDRAVSRVIGWQKSTGRKLFVSVNVSAEEMQDSLLVEQVDAVLKRYEMDPKCLLLEMTEHALLDLSGRPSKTLERLRELGVRIALDDFGTGYSSLSYLENLNIDAIKIDRAFIQSARGGVSRYPVASAMVDIARQLGMFSVAEGIETDEDERVARQIGCDYSQGYFYGRPAAGAEHPPMQRVPARRN